VERRLGEACSAEVLGTGEALAGPGCAGVRALVPTRAYVLRSLLVVAQRHPDVAARITGALLRQQSRHAHLLTLSHLPRADARVLGLLELLAERFGTEVEAGVRVDLPLRHADIGRLVGGRRPTITTAIADLEHDGRLRRDPALGLFVLPAPAVAATAQNRT
jgi:CRP/FNR family transcriptional regulator, cyclic AMP receptor protein